MNEITANIFGRRHASYRCAIPAVGLVAFAAFAALWAFGLQQLVAALLRLIGVDAGAVSFADMSAVLAAVECRQHGIDIYLTNPCDVYGRPHAYSPLWLSIIPPNFGTNDAWWLGGALGVLFISSLALFLRPRNVRELAIFAAAAFSPMTVYAVERGNVDLVIFILVLAVAMLQGGGRRSRLISYTLIVGAALLKYYPAVLLILAGRERYRRALLVGAGAAAVLAIFAACYRGVLGQALANIPVLSYYTDSFSARDLPFGLTTGLPHLPFAREVNLGLFAILLGLAAVWIRRAARLIDPLPVDWYGFPIRLAAIGCLLMTGCFFAGQNVDYRGIFLLFALPGLIDLRNSAAAARPLLSRIIAAVLFVAWEECFRQWLARAFGDQLNNHYSMVFWAVRELVWWWLIATLAALALCYCLRLPLIAELRDRLHRMLPSPQPR